MHKMNYSHMINQLDESTADRQTTTRRLYLKFTQSEIRRSKERKADAA
jgi:hypothetical protein